nr:PREDICTED: copper transporter 2-like [Musa acuminata subsp. malaccensis]
MTFLWGKNSEILFMGWPGTRGSMYALALGVGLAYLVMLAVMSVMSFLLFDSTTSQKTPLQSAGGGIRGNLIFGQRPMPLRKEKLRPSNPYLLHRDSLR